jgi:hypothetical protein
MGLPSFVVAFVFVVQDRDVVTDVIGTVDPDPRLTSVDVAIGTVDQGKVETGQPTGAAFFRRLLARLTVEGLRSGRGSLQDLESSLGALDA